MTRNNTSSLLSICFVECTCPKAKTMAGDVRRVVDAICDAVGECACPDGDFTFTDKGCVLGGKNNKGEVIALLLCIETTST